jgi:hypothetical protein
MTRDESNAADGGFQAASLEKENMANPSLIGEFWEFIKYRKRYWLLPIVVVMLLLGGLIVFTETSAVAPFIYALF